MLRQKGPPRSLHVVRLTEFFFGAATFMRFRITAGFVAGLLLCTPLSSTAQTDMDQVLRVSLRRVLVRDSAICATGTCNGVAIVYAGRDSLALPSPFPVPLIRITPAQADSVRRSNRTFVVRLISVTGSTAEVRIDYLFRGRPPNVFGSPSPPPGTLPAAEGGWIFLLRKDSDGWTIAHTTEWIT